jgi:hypothetical protein
MSINMVERSLKGISMKDFGSAQSAAIGKAVEMKAAGTNISYIGLIFAPEDGCCMC